jgi:hypothetical protein
MKKELGAHGFSQAYWDKNYCEPEHMDGIGNAREHARYLKAYFDLEQVEIKSLIDFGYGLGHLSAALIKVFRPWRFAGLEPSSFAYERGKKRIERFKEIKTHLQQMDICTWVSKQNAQARWFDLGICTSVLQYMSDQEIAQALPTMARMTRYLYLTVPTDRELDKQINVLKFHDDLAIRRSREDYLEMLRQHYTLVSGRIWESKVHFDESSSELSDLLYRI